MEFLHKMLFMLRRAVLVIGFCIIWEHLRQNKENRAIGRDEWNNTNTGVNLLAYVEQLEQKGEEDGKFEKIISNFWKKHY